MLNLLVHQQPQQQHHDTEIVKPSPPAPTSRVNNSLVTKDILKAPLLLEGSEGTEQIALFHRHEIKVGALLGSGSFSDVFEIANFDMQTEASSKKKKKKLLRRPSSSKSTTSSASDTTTTTTTSIANAIEPARRRKRLDLIEQHQHNMQDVYTGKATFKSRFVIKQLHPKLLGDPKLFRRALKDLVTEVSIMSSIEHPHIARLHGTAVGGAEAMVQANSQHDSYFLILDRLVQTLDDRIEAWNQEKIQMGPSYYLDAATNANKMALKANYALQIASALQYLHERRIVFRDLKPQNIGFKEVHPEHPERDVLALFDFGLSRKLPPEEKANADGLYKMSMVGTRRYMAPEVVISKWYDDRADTYSWSLVFYELVTQTRPFDGIQRAEHKQYICIDGKRPKIYSYYGFPAELERLLRFAWAQDVSKRITMTEVCDTLTQYLTGTIHEGCVRQNPETDDSHKNQHTQNKPTVMHDDSISSLISHSTQNTERTVSTTNSFTLDDVDTTRRKQHRHQRHESHSTSGVQASETGAAVSGGGTVPQAIALAASTTSAATTTLHHPNEEEREADSDDGRRVSLCERCMNGLRNTLSKALRIFR